MKKLLIILAIFASSILNVSAQEYIKKDYEINMIGLSINHGRTVIIPGVIRKLRDDLVRMGEYMRLDPCELYPFVNFDGIKNMIREIGYEGIFSVELLVKDEECYFLETNLRNDGLAYIYTAAGANYPALWVDYLTGRLSGQTLNTVSVKTPFFLMHENDMYNIIEKKVGVFQWIKDFFRSDAFFIMNIKDPLPFIVSTLIHVRQFCKMILRKCFNINLR
jgi:hypothetical protein